MKVFDNSFTNKFMPRVSPLVQTKDAQKAAQEWRRIMKVFRQLVAVILTAVCFYCIAQAILYGTVTENQGQADILRLTEPCDSDTAINLQREKEMNGEQEAQFTLWGERQEALISNPEFNRSVKGTAFIVCGDSGLVLKGSVSLGISQKKECLLDIKLARQLFGSTRAEGKSVEIDGITYKVAGTLDQSLGLILIQAGPDMNAAFEGVSIKNTGQENGDAVSQRFSQVTGLEAEPVSSHLYRDWGRAVSRFVPFFLWCSLLGMIGRLICRYRAYPVILLLLLLTGAVVLIGFFLILEIDFMLPVEYLPSRWSDFEFWSRLREQKWGAAEHLLETEKHLPLLNDYWNFLRVVFYSLAALLLSYRTLLKWEFKSGIQLFTAVVFFLLLAFPVVVGNGMAGRSMEDSRAVWLLLPAYCCGKYFLMKEGELLETFIAGGDEYESADR